MILNKVIEARRLLCLAIVLGLPMVPTASADASVKVVAACKSKELSKKPESMVFACADAGLSASRLSWLTWGGKRAKARGEIFYKTCIPNCATGGYGTGRGKVTLYGKTKCRSGLWSYTRARIKVWGDFTYRMKLWPCR